MSSFEQKELLTITNPGKLYTFLDEYSEPTAGAVTQGYQTGSSNIVAAHVSGDYVYALVGERNDTTMVAHTMGNSTFVAGSDLVISSKL